jgi:hypothetical protein
MPSFPVHGNENNPESSYYDPGEVSPWSEADALATSPRPTQRSSVMVYALFPLRIILSTLAVLTPGSIVAHEEAVVTMEGDVQFAITVQNTNILMQKTLTVCCEVTTVQGNTYGHSRTITLDPYERSSLVIEVDIPESDTLSSYTYEVRLI